MQTLAVSPLELLNALGTTAEEVRDSLLPYAAGAFGAQMACKLVGAGD